MDTTVYKCTREWKARKMSHKQWSRIKSEVKDLDGKKWRLQ
jgi:hypothetical protein